MATSDEIKSLGQYMLSVSKDERLEGLDAVIEAISRGAVRIQKTVESGALGRWLGSTGKTNVHGEDVQTLDEIGSRIFEEELLVTGRVGTLGSEEVETAIKEAGSSRGNFVVMMDPIDGSSNIDVAISIGSIFGIWRHTGKYNEDILKPGNQLVAASYTIYGSSTVMVVATKNHVSSFTLDPRNDTFWLTTRDLKLPTDGAYYSVNEGYFNRWSRNMQDAVTSLRNSLSLRYVGSLVADFHRNLLKGGIFLYPADDSSPSGKLRLMYEANPLSFIIEQAGGSSSTGKIRMMDVIPDSLHQRTPMIIGNSDLVDGIVSVLNQS